jgi:nifR3 family TIM-barrel protein
VCLHRPVSIGKVALPGNLFLAPVAGYSDRAFRSVCVDQGADFTCTELVSAEALTRDSRKTEALIRRAANEKAYAVQLFGADPETIGRATALLAPFAPEVVDLNCGCPVPKVVKTGAGAALSRDIPRIGRIVEAMVRASEEHLGGAPVTVKIRSGWDDSSINYREAARAAVEAGAALVALHARTRAQAYSGKADWSHLADLASRLTVPVIGSGDLFSPEAAERMLRETGVAGVMFARGAMGNPFIFAEARALLEQGRYEAVPVAERMRTAILQLELLAADAGEEFACREMRKQFCAYSKGIPGGAAVRNSLVRASTIEDYRKVLREANLLPDFA